MAPPPVPGPSTWDALEAPTETSHLPPPPAYTEYATVFSSSASPRSLPHSRVGGTRTITSSARFTAGTVEPTEAPAVETTLLSLSGPERQLLRLVCPHVEEFLDRLGVHDSACRGVQQTTATTSQHHSWRADLYLVPEDAVPAGEAWQLSGADYLQQGCNHLEVTRVAAINTPTQWKNEKNHHHQQQEEEDYPREAKCACWCVSPSSDEKRQHAVMKSAPSCGYSSSEVSRDLWWRDENQARWLVGYLEKQILQPSRHLSSPPSSRMDKTCGCACHRSDKMTTSRPSRLAEAVEASVRAEEMTFRRENEMGLWESRSGWTLMVSAITRS